MKKYDFFFKHNSETEINLKTNATFNNLAVYEGSDIPNYTLKMIIWLQISHFFDKKFQLVKTVTASIFTNIWYYWGY